MNFNIKNRTSWRAQLKTLQHVDFRIIREIFRGISAAYKFLSAVSRLSTSICGSTCKSILTVLTSILYSKMTPNNPKNQASLDMCLNKIEFWRKVETGAVRTPTWVRHEGQVQKIIKHCILLADFICEQTECITGKLCCLI